MLQTLKRPAALLLGTLALAACGDDDSPFRPELGFLAGTPTDQQIGLVINSTGNALTLFQLGDPAKTVQVTFDPSSEITPTGLSVQGTRAAVPLGNAASTALVDLEAQRIERFLIFPSGNATGSAFADDNTLLVANLIDDYVARFDLRQSGTAPAQTTPVAPAPTDIEVVGTRALVLSSNLDAGFAPIGNGVVTAVDTRTLQVIGTVETGGSNPQDAALGPDGLLYVVNTGDYVSPGSLAVIDPATLQVVRQIPNAGVGPGSISIDRNGIAYISGFSFGTLVYNTRTQQFVRSPDNPICAPLPGGGCRGAADANADANGNVFQVFFGSANQGLKPWVFRYRAGTYELTDSIAAGQGPTAIDVRRF